MFLSHADDALSLAANVHKLLLENEKVRVLEILIHPGEKTAMHWHPESIVYVLSAAHVRYTTPAEVTERELREGDILEFPELIHTAENIGQTVLKAILVELKI